MKPDPKEKPVTQEYINRVLGKLGQILLYIVVAGIFVYLVISYFSKFE